jgi:hypothetical protein
MYRELSTSAGISRIASFHTDLKTKRFGSEQEQVVNTAQEQVLDPWDEASNNAFFQH